MYTVIRVYSGEGASKIADEIEGKLEEVTGLLKSVTGFVGYTLTRTSDGMTSVTTCENKAGADESVKVAAEFIAGNVKAQAGAPTVSEGETIIHTA